MHSAERAGHNFQEMIVSEAEARALDGGGAARATRAMAGRM